MIKDSFTSDIFEHISERIQDYAGDTWNGRDLASEMSMYENRTGAWIIGTYQACEYIRNNWEIARDTFEHFKNNLDIVINPFEDPEAFTFYMLSYGIEMLCSYSDILSDGYDFELTDETISEILSELDEVQNLSACRW